MKLQLQPDRRMLRQFAWASLVLLPAVAWACQRLGSGPSDMKSLTPEAMGRGIETVRRFKAIADAAKAAGLRTYEHVPCPTCGCTTRWVRTYNCVVCRRRKQREADARERARLAAWAEKNGAEGLRDAVRGAIADAGLPPQLARRSHARGPYKKPVPKPQEPVA